MNKFIQHLHLLLLGGLVFSLPLLVQAQEGRGNEGIAAVVFMDSLTVSASRSEFDREAFIQMVQEDRSFYDAFRNLRLCPYRAKHQLTFYNGSGKEKARFQAQTRQIIGDSCRNMVFEQQETAGNFYRHSGAYRYYTAKMYDRVFFNHGVLCDSNLFAPVSHPIVDDPDLKGLEKQYQQLKQFIFQPGERIEVPFIGGRTALFSDRLMEYYNYTIQLRERADGQECYVFSLQVKPEFMEAKENRTIVKYLETWFERGSLQVVGRRYKMHYDGLLFQFDIYMEVDLLQRDGQYMPGRVAYLGKWNIPTKQKEHCRFEMELMDN